MSARELRAAARETGRNGRGLSRRERIAEARRALAEARRRAEIARQVAIARQRAFDQGLRDETAANILKDDVTGEDMEIRRAAVAALGNHAGTVVAMDPKTGRVYSIVNQEWALRRGFKPCSTIKLVTGIAGLSEKVIDPAQTVGVAEANYAIDLTDSLAYSNNAYFQSVGSRVGFDSLIKYARELGLGQPTGINHPNEYAGRVPLYKTGWAVNHMSSHGDDFEVTPIQLASLVSAMANGGTLLVPHLPRTPQEDVSFQKIERRKLNVSQDTLRRMIPGMIGAVNYGTAKGAYDPYQTVAGKTGTCIGQGSWLGLFTSYAPVVDPRLAVVVVTRGSGERGKYAAAVAGKIYRSLDARFGRLTPGQLANTPASLIPHPKINPKMASVVSDEDKEADAEAAQEGLAGTEQTTQTGAGAGTIKSTVLTAPAKQPAAQQPATTQPKAAPVNQSTPAKKSDERPRQVNPPRQ